MRESTSSRKMKEASHVKKVAEVASEEKWVVLAAVAI